MKKLLKSYKTLSIQAKSAIWFAVCSMFQKGISFITVPIFTRLLSIEEYGTYSLYNSWSSILTIITSLYLFNGVLNNAMVKFENDRDRYISSMQGLTITVTIIVFIIYLLFIDNWTKLLGLAPIYMLLMFIEMSISPSLSYWSGKQRFEYKYKKLVIITVAQSILNPVLGLIAVSLSTQRDLARIISIVVVEVFFCGIIMVFQFVRGKAIYVKEYWKYALAMGIPLLPHYLSSMILNQGDRIMIENIVGRSEVAFYSVAYNIGMLVQLFTHAIGNSFIPWMYQKLKKEEYEGIGKTINGLLLIVACIAFGIMLLSPEVVRVFGSEEYSNAAYVIPPVASSVFFIFLYNLLSVPQFYFEKTNYMLFASIAAAILNVALNYIFIKLYGYIAAGYTTLVCYILYSLGHYLISTRVLRKKIQEETDRIYDKKIITGISIAIIGMGIGCNYIFKHWYVRYGILLVGLIAAYCNRKKFIDIFHSIKR